MADDRRGQVFDEWMARHRPILFKVARAYGADRADRDDLFQEIAVQVWRSVDAFGGRSSVATWIYRVAINAALAWRRKEGRHRRGREEFDAATARLAAPDDRDPRLDWIYRRIAELDEINRSLALLMLDGFSYRDMAQIVGIGESNVGVRINRIKAALAARLAQEEQHGL